MNRGPLYDTTYRPQLSGHETFPLRYGWLKKAYDAVKLAAGTEDDVSVFSADDAIARFGVGKNMVASMRHWANAAGIIEEKSGRPITTSFGYDLFDDVDGLDPFMENPNTSWLIHWKLCSHPAKTSWYWAFNYYTALTFHRDIFVRNIAALANDRGWTRASQATIKNDVACFVRTYVAHGPKGNASHEDSLESPLTELGLIRSREDHHGLRFVRGRKPSLGPGVFTFAVTEFWRRHSPSARTLSFEALAHEPGSPGRVFQLDENDLVDRLYALEDSSQGRYTWSETAGLKQIVRDFDFDSVKSTEFIESDYSM